FQLLDETNKSCSFQQRDTIFRKPKSSGSRLDEPSKNGTLTPQSLAISHQFVRGRHVPPRTSHKLRRSALRESLLFPKSPQSTIHDRHTLRASSHSSRSLPSP